MHYFALLLSPEATGTPDPAAQAAEMAAYQSLHALAASAIRAGDALTPSALGKRIAGGPGHRRAVRRRRRGRRRVLGVRG
jgi:hypothetical protein